MYLFINLFIYNFYLLHLDRISIFFTFVYVVCTNYVIYYEYLHDITYFIIM